MVKLKIAIRIIMNISIAFFSSLWVYFFAISGDIALSVVEKIEPTVMPMPGGAEFYYSPVGRD